MHFASPRDEKRGLKSPALHPAVLQKCVLCQRATGSGQWLALEAMQGIERISNQRFEASDPTAAPDAGTRTYQDRFEERLTRD